ncbi:MAG: hypothetical protein KGQ49_04325 [Verrucomicrobia bacterium]|nr:hypothetical protein [Verrucomicrobiota bacterium]MBU6446604.1 hypothetical protein [Verrucomicrobiota bacterium]
MFTVDCDLVRQANSCGIDAIIVDWEWRGKEERQKNFDTQINHHTLDDLKAVAKIATIPIICRINAISADTKQEIEAALSHGAAELLIPMVRTKREVEQALDWTQDRAKVGILIETNAAVNCAMEMSSLPLSRMYLGMNDLCVENRSPHIFTPLVNGQLDALRPKIARPFGFGGLTLPHLGHPIPCQLLVDAMVRLDCHFSFLRRAFLKDTAGKNMGSAVSQIRHAIHCSREKSFQQLLASHRELQQCVERRAIVQP